MNQLKQLEEILRNLRFGETADNLPELLKKAEKNEITYVSFLMDVMKHEQKRREEKKIERHLKWATFPYHKTLEAFDLKEQQSLSNKQFNKLRELLWMEQLYNLILLGPPGVGNYRKLLFMERYPNIVTKFVV